MTSFSRRSVLAGAAAAPLIPTLASTASAGGHGAMVTSRARSFLVGDFHVTTLLDASGANDNPQGIFGMNVSEEEFADVSAQNFIPSDSFQGFFTPVVIETGSETILFDTGLGQGGLITSLGEAGIRPEDVTHVVITHMHPDHINGMLTDGAPTFPNAVYVTGRAEYDFWVGQGEGNRIYDIMSTNVIPFADQMTFLEDGQDVRGGITAMAAFGHTPGLLNFMIESGGQQLYLGSDLANHYVWSLAYPDWEVRFDMDKEAAAATRRRVLGMLASERIPMLGYHMPFPGAGYVETREDGFRWVPVTYQMSARS